MANKLRVVCCTSTQRKVLTNKTYPIEVATKEVEKAITLEIAAKKNNKHVQDTWCVVSEDGSTVWWELEAVPLIHGTSKLRKNKGERNR